ncbi:hypothetical protein LBMAG49_24190 [Planctomycetota bacterium]|nr:hypothetical protein LBMAG49_24190 [Planctomycetota bacterium]
MWLNSKNRPVERLSAPGLPLARRLWLWRLIWRIAAAFLAATGLVVLLFGYTAKISPPVSVEPAVTVFVIRDQLHRGIVLPLPAGYVEFGFGSFEWYARAKDRWYHAMATVLSPNQGTLSRREHHVTDAAALQSSMPAVTLLPLAVSGKLADALRARLQAQFDDSAALAVYRTGMQMQFVPWARDYWFADNCNHAIVQWCAELGCTATSVPLLLDVELAAPK